jgi:vacuolar protein sorting-associated protein 13A/C
MQALLPTSGQTDMQLLENISMMFSVQSSIVPTMTALPRFKVIGTLPKLQINFSDTKYKSLMRLIDVCIPQFNSAGGTPNELAINIGRREFDPGFRLATGIFSDVESDFDFPGDTLAGKSAIRKSDVVIPPFFPVLIIR